MVKYRKKADSTEQLLEILRNDQNSGTDNTSKAPAGDEVYSAVLELLEEDLSPKREQSDAAGSGASASGAAGSRSVNPVAADGPGALSSAGEGRAPRSATKLTRPDRRHAETPAGASDAQGESIELDLSLDAPQFNTAPQPGPDSEKRSMELEASHPSRRADSRAGSEDDSSLSAPSATAGAAAPESTGIPEAQTAAARLSSGSGTAISGQGAGPASSLQETAEEASAAAADGQGGDAPEADGSPLQDAFASSGEGQKKSFGSGRGARKPLFSIDLGLARGPRSILGVDVNSDTIRVVRMSKRDSSTRLEGMAEYPIPPDTKVGSDEYVDTLRRALERHTNGRDCEIWTALRIVEIDIAPLLIPKVKPSRVAETVYWKLQKEKKYDSREYALDFRVQEHVKDGGVSKINVLTCLARREGIDRLADWFGRAGFPLTGITALPTAFRHVYLGGHAQYEGELCANIHVDTNFSCITIYDGRQILFCRTIKSGTYGMAESLMDAYNSSNRASAELSFEATPRTQENSLTLHSAKRLIYKRLLAYEKYPPQAGDELGEEDILDMTYSAVDRLARQAERTLEYFYTNFNRRCDYLHLSGEIFACRRIYDFFAAQLSLPMALFSPLEDKRLHSPDVQEAGTAKALGFNLAAALSLVDSRSSVNLLENYEKRDQKKRRKRLDNAMALSSMVLVALAASVYLVLAQMADADAERLEVLQNRLEQFEPRVTESELALMTARVGAEKKSFKKLGRKYESLALLAELQDLTPENVRLLRVDMDFGPLPEPADGQGAKSKAAKRRSAAERKAQGKLMVVEGVVLSGRDGYDTTVSRYLIGLESSPLFSQPSILSSSVTEFVPEGEVMQFVLHVGVN